MYYYYCCSFFFNAAHHCLFVIYCWWSRHLRATAFVSISTYSSYFFVLNNNNNNKKVQRKKNVFLNFTFVFFFFATVNWLTLNLFVMQKKKKYTKTSTLSHCLNFVILCMPFAEWSNWNFCVADKRQWRRQRATVMSLYSSLKWNKQNKHITNFQRIFNQITKKKKHRNIDWMFYDDNRCCS